MDSHAFLISFTLCQWGLEYANGIPRRGVVSPAKNSWVFWVWEHNRSDEEDQLQELWDVWSIPFSALLQAQFWPGVKYLLECHMDQL